MPSAQVSRPLLHTSIEPVKEKRLELGKKVFKVPTQSKRKSSRIQRPETSNDEVEDKPTEIFHNLLLAPTLKRQRKKKLERARRAKRKRKYFNSRMKIKITDVFAKKRRLQTQQSVKKAVTIILDDSKIHAVRKTITPDDFVKIGHLARCGGTQSISGLDVFDEIEYCHNDDSEVPPPFEARDDDPYIVPQPGQLISYVWYTRPSPVLGRKHIYRTGILCSTDGAIRFFENEDECLENKNVDRKFFEGKFYLNKQVFTMGNFRVRTDLVVGAICYERERKFPCKILQIDEECGAVLVQSLKSEGSTINLLWISPDDLVGNYTPINKNIPKTQLTPTKTSGHVGQISPSCVSQKTIDLTEDDEDESDPGVVTPDVMPARYRPLDSLLRVLPPESTYVPHPQVERSSDTERAIAEIVADACKSLEPPSAILSAHNRGLLRHANPNPRTIHASSMVAGISLGSPVGVDRVGLMGSSSSLSSYGSMAIQSEIKLLKQHRMALEVLMSANDFVTIQATLQHIKRLQQRGIPVGPTTAELVVNKERTSLVMMENAVFVHMTTPAWSGGKGYKASHMRIILSRLAPILRSSLGRLDSPMINSMTLMKFGLDRVESSDIMPYLQSLEEEILMKSLKLKRQLSTVY